MVQGTFWFFHVAGLKHRIQATPPEMYDSPLYGHDSPLYAHACAGAGDARDYDHP